MKTKKHLKSCAIKGKDTPSQRYNKRFSLSKLISIGVLFFYFLLFITCDCEDHENLVELPSLLFVKQIKLQAPHLQIQFNKSIISYFFKNPGITSAISIPVLFAILVL